MSAAALRVASLSTGYGAIQALWDVDLEVHQGEIVALIGSNGAGKTTTLRTISGLMRRWAGSIEFDGRPIDRLSAHRIVELGIAHVPEARRIFGNLTVEENLEAGAFARGRREQAATKDFVYGLFPFLAERSGQSAATLSGGEQQMLALARALMSKPKLLLLDEPSLGIMPKLVRRLFETVEALREHTTILLVEQNVKLALTVADRGYVLENGRVTLNGFSDDLANDARVARAYLGRDPLETGLKRPDRADFLAKRGAPDEQ